MLPNRFQFQQSYHSMLVTSAQLCHVALPGCSSGTGFLKCSSIEPMKRRIQTFCRRSSAGLKGTTSIVLSTLPNSSTSSPSYIPCLFLYVIISATPYTHKHLSAFLNSSEGSIHSINWMNAISMGSLLFWEFPFITSKTCAPIGLLAFAPFLLKKSERDCYLQPSQSHTLPNQKHGVSAWEFPIFV